MYCVPTTVFNDVVQIYFSGIYKFVFESGHLGNEFRVYRGSSETPRGVSTSVQLDGEQLEFTAYLRSGETLQYKGGGGNLHGVRLGDDL